MGGPCSQVCALMTWSLIPRSTQLSGTAPNYIIFTQLAKALKYILIINFQMDTLLREYWPGVQYDSGNLASYDDFYHNADIDAPKSFPFANYRTPEWAKQTPYQLTAKLPGPPQPSFNQLDRGVDRQTPAASMSSFSSFLPILATLPVVFAASYYLILENGPTPVVKEKRMTKEVKMSRERCMDLLSNMIASQDYSDRIRQSIVDVDSDG